MYLFDTTQLKIIRYRRKSTEDEDRQIASLPDQAIALDEVAARFHIDPSQIVADFGESRIAKLSHARPEFQRMTEMDDEPNGTEGRARMGSDLGAAYPTAGCGGREAYAIGQRDRVYPGRFGDL